MTRLAWPRKTITSTLTRATPQRARQAGARQFSADVHALASVFAPYTARRLGAAGAVTAAGASPHFRELLAAARLLCMADEEAADVVRHAPGFWVKLQPVAWFIGFMCKCAEGQAGTEAGARKGQVRCRCSPPTNSIAAPFFAPGMRARPPHVCACTTASTHACAHNHNAIPPLFLLSDRCGESAWPVSWRQTLLPVASSSCQVLIRS